MLLTSNCFEILLYKANYLICHRLYDRYSLTPLLYSGHFVALLTCRVRARSEVCWSGSAQPSI